MSSPSQSDYGRHMERRDSASSGKRSSRPRLLRASATEPSLAPSTASREALPTPSHSSSQRAADILNRMAYVGGTSPPSAQSPLYEEGMSGRTDTLCSSPTSQATDDLYTRPNGSERYFSFPRFDAWECHEDESKDSDDKSAG